MIIDFQACAWPGLLPFSLLNGSTRYHLREWGATDNTTTSHRSTKGEGHPERPGLVFPQDLNQHTLRAQ